MLVVIQSLLSLAMLTAFAASMVSWTKLIYRFRNENPIRFAEALVPPRPRRPPFWGPVEAILMFGAMLVLGQAILLVGQSWGWFALDAAGAPTESDGATAATGIQALVFANTFGGLGAVALIVGWLTLMSGNGFSRLGLTVRPGDVRLGLTASLMILPPVLVISSLVSILVPYEHPVLDSLESLKEPASFAMTFFGTALATPVIEEVLMRGLLQGGLQRLADRPPQELTDWKPNAYWPLLVSSFLFAVMHYGQGAAPIPLFLLALGLGFLYRQTGSLTPPIIVHMVLNGMTLAVVAARPPVA